MADSSSKVIDNGCVKDSSSSHHNEADRQKSAAKLETSSLHLETTKDLLSPGDANPGCLSTENNSAGKGTCEIADADLLSEFQSGLEKTLSLVAHMSEEMKLKALESLKVILPDHSPSLGIRADTSHQISVSDPESGPHSAGESPSKVCGSAKRKIPTRGGMPKKLTSTIIVDPIESGVSMEDHKKTGMTIDAQTEHLKGARKRGRPRKSEAATHDSVYIPTRKPHKGPNVETIEYVKPKRRRGPPRRYIVDYDDEIGFPSTVNIKKEKTDVNHSEREFEDSPTGGSPDKSKLVKEEHSSEFELADEEDGDWRPGDKVEGGATFHRKIYAYKAGGGECETNQPKQARSVKTEDGMWKCSVCGKGSSNKQNIVVHLRTHTGERPYQCKVCGRSFSIVTNMQRHVRDRHGHKPNLTCPVQGCAQVFWGAKSMSEHMNKTHPGESNPWRKTVECGDCHKVFKSRAMLKVHCAMHQTDKPFSCAVCKRAFSFKTNLLRHAWTHKDSNLYPHKCSICDKKYIEKKSLDSHVMRDHHGMKGRSEEDRKFQCEICDKKFFTKGNYNHHQVIHSGSKPYNCPVCGKKFSMKSNMQRHLQTHSGEKPWQCSVCDKRFTEKKSLKVHQRQHTGERPYKCDICGKAYSQLGTLHSHMPVHNKERNFLCLYCGKSFLRKSHFNFHMKKHNTGPTLPCSQCDMKFYRNGDLERHLITHTNEKPYLCSLCPKRFTRMQYLKEHGNQHTGARPHKCKQCDMAFADSSSMYKHQRVHSAQNLENFNKIVKKELEASSVTPLAQIVQPLLVTNQDEAGLSEETIFTDFNTTGTERTYICKLCQAALPDLETCYEHQKEHNNSEVSFVVTLKQPEECEMVEKAVTQHKQTESVMDVQQIEQDSSLNSHLLQPRVVTSPTVVSEGNQLTIENVMQISRMASNIPSNVEIIQGPTTGVIEPGTHMDDQVIKAVSMTTGDITTKYYMTEAGQSLAPIPMVMEEVQDISIIPQSMAAQESQQPYIILLNNNT